MVNQVILIGYLGRDPDVKQVASGKTVANFRIGTSKSWVTRDGVKQTRTSWHNIVIWGRMAEVCGQKLAKGSKVYIEGELDSRSYEDRDGAKRYVTEVLAYKILFLDKSNEANPESPQNSMSFGAEPSFDANEELPF